MPSLSKSVPALVAALVLCYLIGFAVVTVNPAAQADAQSNSQSQLVAFNEQQQEAVTLKAALAQQRAQAEIAMQQDLDNKFSQLEQELNSYLAKQVGTYGYMLESRQQAGTKSITRNHRLQ